MIEKIDIDRVQLPSGEMAHMWVKPLNIILEENRKFAETHKIRSEDKKGLAKESFVDYCESISDPEIQKLTPIRSLKDLRRLNEFFLKKSLHFRNGYRIYKLAAGFRPYLEDHTTVSRTIMCHVLKREIHIKSVVNAIMHPHGLLRIHDQHVYIKSDCYEHMVGYDDFMKTLHSYIE